jgi:hypothetical protein
MPAPRYHNVRPSRSIQLSIRWGYFSPHSVQLHIVENQLQISVVVTFS